MNIPYIARGGSLGAVLGGAGAAATGEKDQTMQQRLGRGILGGMAGGALGTGVHAGLRYRSLKNLDVDSLGDQIKGTDRMKVNTGKMDSSRAGDEALFGTGSVKDYAKGVDKDNKNIRNIANTTQAEAEAAREAERVSEAKKSYDQSNMFYGMDPKAAAKLKRQELKQYHPDRTGLSVGDPGYSEAIARFQKMTKDYEDYLVNMPMNKKASASYLQYHYFFKHLTS